MGETGGTMRWQWLGMLKVYQTRLSSYLQIISFLGIIWLNVMASKFLTWWMAIILMAIGIPLILFIDVKFIYPHVQAYVFQKNPEWMEQKRKVEWIYKKLGGK